VIAACHTGIPLRSLPPHVIVVRRQHGLPGPRPRPGKRQPGVTLHIGDELRVSPPGLLSLMISGNRYRVRHGVLRLLCRPRLTAQGGSSAPRRTLAIDLQQGRVSVASARHVRLAMVISPEMVASATGSATHFYVDRNPQARSTRAATRDRPIIAARRSDPALRITTRPTYTAISDPKGIRLDIWPFSLSRLQRRPDRSDRLPEFWADSSRCAVGCSAAGKPGWPLKPFFEQHAIRAGIDELRPANFHVAIDIQANNFQRVYAIQSGIASPAATGSYGDDKVTVGSYTYWHIVPTVRLGQRVTAYKTIIGRVEHGFGHMAFQQGTDNDYLNPLRPGGPLRPYTDTEPPVIGRPQIFSDGRAIIGAFDPQSFIHKQSYETPVLAPAALAWRLYTARGQPLTGLEWALRSTGYTSPGLKPVIFARGAANPGFACFYTQLRCIPNWVYNLAGGLTRPLPLTGRHRRYRLSVYAWDFKGNESALDDWITFPLTPSEQPKLDEFGPLNAQYDP
jgi:hypothetical protein